MDVEASYQHHQHRRASPGWSEYEGRIEEHFVRTEAGAGARIVTVGALSKL